MVSKGGRAKPLRRSTLFGPDVREWPRGVQEVHSEAAKWYRKNAEQGKADAQFYLGLAYSRGVGVPLDPATAIEWYRKSAEQGNITAQENLGKRLWKSRQDFKTNEEAFVAMDEAEKWLFRSLNAGNDEVLAILADIYLFMASNLDVYKKPDMRHVAWHQRNADKGNAYSQFFLYFTYRRSLRSDGGKNGPLKEEVAEKNYELYKANVTPQVLKNLRLMAAKTESYWLEALGGRRNQFDVMNLSAIWEAQIILFLFEPSAP